MGIQIYSLLWEFSAIKRNKVLRCATRMNLKNKEGFLGGALVENAGDTGSSPGLGRSHMPWSN